LSALARRTESRYIFPMNFAMQTQKLTRAAALTAGLLLRGRAQ